MSIACAFLDDLFALAQKPQCGLVIICAAPGAGKTHLAKALAKIPELGLLHVSQDLWINKATHVRIRELGEAYKRGHRERIKYLCDQRNIYNWPKFHHDFAKLMQTGSLDLHNVYNHATGELTDNVRLSFSPMPPHLVLLEGSAILHDPWIKRAALVLHIDIAPHVLRDRRFGRDGLKKSNAQLQEADTRWTDWATQYFPHYMGNANYILGQDDEDALLRLAEKLMSKAPRNGTSIQKPHKPGLLCHTGELITLHS